MSNEKELNDQVTRCHILSTLTDIYKTFKQGIECSQVNTKEFQRRADQCLEIAKVQNTIETETLKGYVDRLLPLQKIAIDLIEYKTENNL